MCVPEASMMEFRELHPTGGVSLSPPLLFTTCISMASKELLLICWVGRVELGWWTGVLISLLVVGVAGVSSSSRQSVVSNIWWSRWLTTLIPTTTIESITR